MGKQLEKGTQFPMRPAVAIISPDADTCLYDPGTVAAVNWTAAGSKMILGSIQYSAMDDNSDITLDVASKEVDLRAGIYLFDIAFLVSNSDAGDAENVAIAVTNAGGTTVHAVTNIAPSIQPSSNSYACLRAVVHLSTDQAIAIRTVQITNNHAGGVTVTAIQGEDQAIMIQRIGNANES